MHPLCPRDFPELSSWIAPALENHAAMLEQTLNEKFPGATPDHLASVRTQYMDPQASTGLLSPEINFSQSFNFQPGTSPDTERMREWQPPQTPAVFERRTDGPVLEGHGGRNPLSPRGPTSQALATTSRMVASFPVQPAATRPEGMDKIPTTTAASFFRTYFQFIHPQYPFLGLKDCGG